MDKINVNNLSNEMINQLKEDYTVIVDKIISDIKMTRKEIEDIAGVVKISNIKVENGLKKLLKLGGKIILNTIIAHKLDVDPVHLDNDVSFLKGGIEEKRKFYAKCKTEQLAALCFEDLEKGMAKVREMLQSNDTSELKNIISMFDTLYVTCKNNNYIKEKSDLFLYVLLCATDNEVVILPMESLEKCKILHNYHKANLGLEYDYLKDLSSIREKIDRELINNSVKTK